MREILFRGKRSDNGNWISGSLFTRCGECYIVPLPLITSKSKVDPETIGQYTGLTDKDGKKIFEGDIIQIPYDYNVFGHNAGEMYEVYFAYGGFRLKPKYSKTARGYWLEDDKTVKVFGNIHDNSGLLEKE